MMEQIPELERTGPEAPAAPAPLSREVFERRCFAELGALLEEANRGRLTPSFVCAATWHLAAVAQRYGPRAMADIMRQLAGHMDHIGDIEDARREAEEAKAQGRLPQ